MASTNCSRIICRLYSISSIKSVIRVRTNSSLLNTSATMSSQRLSCSTSTAPPAPQFQYSIRNSANKLGSVQSLLPLHSVVATARMISYLSIDSRSCQALSHGTFCCNSRGPKSVHLIELASYIWPKVRRTITLKFRTF